MAFWSYIQKENLKSISVIGIAKNVGKTVFLNQVVEEGKRRGLVLGLMSMGRDGEERDSLLNISKPPVRVYPGSYLVSAARSLDKSTARFRIVESLNIPTSLGETYLVGVLEEGEVELVGPRSRDEILRARKALERYTDLILVDGALNRKTSAAPDLTDGTFLVVGAAAAPTLKGVREKAAGVINCFQLPVISGRLRNLAGELLAEQNSGVIVEETGKLKVKPLQTGSGYQLAGVLEDCWSEQIIAVVISGALTDSIYSALQKREAFKLRGQVIVTDATKIFLNRHTFKMIFAEGPEIRLFYPVRLVGIVTNAYHPGGRSLEPGQLAREIKDLAPGLPVIDLASNIHLPPVKNRQK